MKKYSLESNQKCCKIIRHMFFSFRCRLCWENGGRCHGRDRRSFLRELFVNDSGGCRPVTTSDSNVENWRSTSRPLMIRWYLVMYPSEVLWFSRNGNIHLSRNCNLFTLRIIYWRTFTEFTTWNIKHRSVGNTFALSCISSVTIWK